MNAFTRNIRTGRLAALTDFVISSINTIPCCSTASIASCFSLPGSPVSPLLLQSAASWRLYFQLTRFLLLAAQVLEHGLQWLVISSMPGGAIISTPIGAAQDRSRFLCHQAGLHAVFCGSLTSSGRFLLLFGLSPVVFSGGISTSRIRSSASSSAR